MVHLTRLIGRELGVNQDENAARRSCRKSRFLSSLGVLVGDVHWRVIEVVSRCDLAKSAVELMLEPMRLEDGDDVRLVALQEPKQVLELLPLMRLVTHHERVCIPVQGSQPQEL